MADTPAGCLLLQSTNYIIIISVKMHIYVYIRMLGPHEQAIAYEYMLSILRSDHVITRRRTILRSNYINISALQLAELTG